MNSYYFRWSHTDLLRLKEGKVGAQLWTAYAPCGSQHKDAVQITLEQGGGTKQLLTSQCMAESCVYVIVYIETDIRIQ